MSAPARTRTVETTSEPASDASDTWIPPAAPIASALRIVSGAFAPAIDEHRDLAAVLLDELERRLERVLVVGVDDGRGRGAIEPEVGSEPLAARGGIRDRLHEDDDSHGRAVSWSSDGHAATVTRPGRRAPGR